MEEELEKELHGLKLKPAGSSLAKNLQKQEAIPTSSKQEDQKTVHQLPDSKHQKPQTLRKLPTTIGKMIDRKQIRGAAGINPSGLMFNFESSTAKTQQLKKASTTVTDNEKKKKSYGGGSMLSFFK